MQARWVRVRGSRWRALVPVVALAAGLLFATSAATAQGTDLRADRRLRVTELIARERNAIDRQEQVAGSLRDQVRGLQQQAADRDDRVAAVQRSAEPLALAAGLVALEGDGVRVSLDDAPRPERGREPASDNPDDLVVHQQDLQAVVNALWRGGADGLALMGQRIVSTSAVRCVGNTVILHGRVYGPPFVVTAVGDPSRLREALEDEPGVSLFREYVEEFGLGYEVRTERRLRLPAYDGPLELTHVRRAP